MTDIPEPEISPAFTMEDIHKVRAWIHEKRKRMSPEEFREDSRRSAERIYALLDAKPDPEISAEVDRRLKAAYDDD